MSLQEEVYYAFFCHSFVTYHLFVLRMPCCWSKTNGQNNFAQTACYIQAPVVLRALQQSLLQKEFLSRVVQHVMAACHLLSLHSQLYVIVSLSQVRHDTNN